MIRLSCSVYTIANDQLFCILSFSSSGICLDCQDNTQGHNCEECLPNFYQRHGEGTADACLPCPCSSESSSGSCHLGESASLWHTDGSEQLLHAAHDVLKVTGNYSAGHNNSRHRKFDFDVRCDNNKHFFPFCITCTYGSCTRGPRHLHFRSKVRNN